MTDEEAFHTFIFGLQPHLQEHVGAHVQGDMEAAIAKAQRLEVYRGGDGAKTGSKGPKSSNKTKREMWRRSRGARLGGPSRWPKL